MANAKRLLDNFIKKFHGIRYDVPDRKMRRYNSGSREKNPNKVDFWALNEGYAEEFNPEYLPTTKREADIEGRFFDMVNNYKQLEAYKQLVDNVKRDAFETYNYTINSKDINPSTKDDTAKQFKIRYLQNKDFVDSKGRVHPSAEHDVDRFLQWGNFQGISDFGVQNILAKELKDLGYDGYYVDGVELAVFPWAKDYGKGKR